MNPGQLHEIISIEQSTKTKTGTKSYTTSWSDLATDIRAKIVANDPEFIEEEGQRKHQQTYMVTIRKDAAALTDIGQIRIDWNGAKLTVLTIVNKRQASRDRFWKILCAEEDGVV